MISDEKIISGSGDNTIRLWNLRSGECIFTFCGHKSSIWCLKVILTINLSFQSLTHLFLKGST